MENWDLIVETTNLRKEIWSEGLWDDYFKLTKEIRQFWLVSIFIKIKVDQYDYSNIDRRKAKEPTYAKNGRWPLELGLDDEIKTLDDDP